MNVYEKMQEAALEILAEMGKDIEIKREVGEVHDPIRGTVTPGTTQTHQAKGVVVNYRNEEIDGTKIRRGDRLCVIEAKSLSIVPNTDDRVEANNTAYTVEDVEVAMPTDVPIVYFLQVRQ